MQIKGLDNQFVEIRITGYEFPANKNDEYDSNWLLISVNAQTKRGKWKTTDPSLLTWEVEEIINYFRALAKFQECDEELSFVEPNLSFVLINNAQEDIKKIRIIFNLESRPQSANDDVEYFMEFHVDSKGLTELAMELDAELKKYPIR